MRRLLGLLLLFTSAAAFAQTADLHVTLEAPAAASAGEDIVVRATLVNAGPDTATNVDFRVQLGEVCSASERYSSLAAGATKVLSCTGTVGNQLRFLSAVGFATADTTDPDNTNNYRYQTVEVATDADLEIGISQLPPLDPGLPFELRVTYTNHAVRPATGARFTIDIPLAHGFADVPSNCEVQSQFRVTCFLGDVPGTSFDTLTLHPIAEDTPLGFMVQVHGAITSDRPDPHPENNTTVIETPLYWTWFVTNTSDSGSGSLRAAIQSANASCTGAYPCKVAFRISPTSAKWITITPETPLPNVTGHNVAVDASVQKRYFSDTNPAGPEIELDGSVAGGNGITVMTPCAGAVSGLAVNRFTTAILVNRESLCDGKAATFPSRIAENYLGTDPTGRYALPNLRGVVLLPRAGGYFVTENVISGNTRSGIWSVAPNVRIAGNRIGLTPNDQPLGNGASGIYVEAPAYIDDNRIAFNHDFGISIARGVKDVSISGNSIHANWQLGIDNGLDGASPEVPGANGVVRIPVITAARYDAATNTTLIEGTADADTTFTATINLYANDERDPSGYGEGQYALGAVPLLFDHTFSARVAGRLPGRWVTATTTRTWYYGLLRIGDLAGNGNENALSGATSEFSRAVEVSGD